MLHVHRKKCLEMEKQLQQSKKQKFSEGLLVGAALGVAMGALAGLLLAPDSGRETMSKVSRGVRNMRDKCKAMMPSCCCGLDDYDDEDLDFASDFEEGFDHDDQYHETFSQEEPIEE